MEAAIAARDYGADIIGFVFADSIRRISVRKASDIVRKVPGVRKAGVFVNAPLAEVLSIARECRLDYVQLHGSESPEYCRQLGYPIIKAYKMGANLGETDFTGFSAAMTLFDSFVAGQQGGTGIAFDWQKTWQLARSAPKPLMIAGGLTPLNVAEAIKTLEPDGVDVSGGVESGGRKDLEKIRQFIMAARGV